MARRSANRPQQARVHAARHQGTDVTQPGLTPPDGWTADGLGGFVPARDHERPETRNLWVQAPAAMRDAGMTFAEIAAVLNAEGVPTPRAGTRHAGREWWPSTIQRALRR